MRSSTQSHSQSIVWRYICIWKQNNFVVWYPLGFKKSETYLRFYVYTCPIYFIAPTCLEKTYNHNINIILEQFHFFVPYRPRKCCLSVSSSIPNQYPIQNRDPSGSYRCSINFVCIFNQSLIDINATNKQDSVENPKEER